MDTVVNGLFMRVIGRINVSRCNCGGIVYIVNISTAPVDESGSRFVRNSLICFDCNTEYSINGYGQNVLQVDTSAKQTSFLKE